MSDPNTPEDPKETQTQSESTDNASSDTPKDEGPSAEDIWGDAFAEQEAAEDSLSEASAEDIWGDAFAEEAATAPEATETTHASASEDIFKPLDTGDSSGGLPRELDVIMEIPVTMSVELGRTRLTIRQLLDLAKGSVVELDGLAGEPMDILVNGYLIAQGEVVVVDDKYGIRITDIVTPTERIQRLNR
ncbi:flagellar motor switch protein FliN [Larsenimonas suaedae]|uniref:Flagellar motor switch protein FliN n=1 Tax=Larsenimonas suaedae TaxID=1851019 RepID=A0ABU1GT58_9GAMM|nr:flagellar motor switch protein FliN [Larsenimonas suaedae]MCM2971612.1 flagellar motor switch protein FliN [Larsenimonas suaedae]MDR5895164.1 flagellar motor switch protein FliN [Larsenimonas suaedae]